MNKFYLCIIIILYMGCSDSSNEEENQDTDSDVDTDIDTDKDTEKNTDSGKNGTDTKVTDGTDTEESVCGNGILEPGEMCDDGNNEDGDGCSADCLEVEPDFICYIPGEPCLRVSTCGNGIIEGDEVCDDGNTEDGDGCSANCRWIEDGFSCIKPGEPCVVVSVCGNGIRERGEQCDDGNTEDGDGCSADCQLEEGWFCMPGQPCVQEICGDGVRTPGEQCDDGNNEDVDGCSADCIIEPGWICPPGGACRPICGDGLVRGNEECDSPDTNACINCRLVPGFVCGPDGNAEICEPTVCGNGILEPGEGCDDGNTIAGDGCGPTCQLEPQILRPGPDFTPVVQTLCGDGLKTGNEECDDGNTKDGDGCSADCKIEPGWTCEDIISYPETIEFQVTYRDFKRRVDSGGHPDFQWLNPGLTLGMPGPVCTASASDPCAVEPGEDCLAGTCGRLDADGKPVLHKTGTDAQRGGVSNAGTYSLWYRDDNPDEIEGAGDAGIIDMWNVKDVLLLTHEGNGAYVFASASHFPLDELGFGNTPGQSHNFHFTTELRYFFQYRGGETLTFRGDDDVWVFINGRHAVDIGGVHGARWGRVVLGDDGTGDSLDSDCSVHGSNNEPAPCSLEPDEIASDVDIRFDLVKGNVYEIVLFHAERHTTQSNFRLTLDGFLAPRSYCTTTCGDGIVAGTEMCDDGADMPDEGYGVCRSDCTIDFCGDAYVSHDEQCDNGFNQDVYAWPGSWDPCGPGCLDVPFCGDGFVQSEYELCDNGQDNSDDAYNGCTTFCDWGPYCGDNIINGPEECDDGPGNMAWSPDGEGCSYFCTRDLPYCGDGIRNGPEQCDLGADMNTGEYGGCNPDCTLAPYCGDMIVDEDEGEECDDGPTGSLQCTPDCRSRGIIIK